MANKRIVWSPRAMAELKSILEFYNIKNGNSKYSSKIVDSVEDIIELISKNNHIGRLTSDHKTRVVNLDIFLIFYELSINRIDILSFWDNRQDPKKRIK